MQPIVISATEAAKPGVACVTSTPTALAVIIAQHVGHVGEEDARHALRPHRENLTLGKKF